jgi:putative membrane protein
MKRTHFSAALATAAGLLFSLSGAALAQNDTTFAKEAAIGGMTEVQLGQLAVQKGQNQKVKEFGQKMVDDHSKANDKLKEVAAKDNITLPSQLDAKHQATVDRFAKMNGTEFDRAYVRDMVQDHEQDVAKFQQEANSGSNKDLKNFASETLPTLQEHLRMAKENASTVGATSRK